MAQKYPFNIFHLLIILICACLVRSQAVCDGCLCNPPDIDATSVKANYLVRKITGNSSISWALDVNITWTAPLNTSHDYAVQFTRNDGGPLRCFDTVLNQQFASPFDTNSFICPIRKAHRHVTGELYSEMDIAFGYSYIIDVCLYNATSNALAPYSICVTHIYSPDCYEETEDVDFCKNQPIVVSGKPINASLSHFTLGDDSSDNATIDALIIWSDPIQVNGAINRYNVESYDVARPTDRQNLQMVSYAQANGNTSTVYEAHIPGLTPDTKYRVDIVPYVVLPSEEFRAGRKAEILFTTSSPKDLPLKMARSTTPFSTTNASLAASTDATPIATTMMMMTSSSVQDTVQAVTPGRVIDVLNIGIVSSIATIFLIVLLILAIVCVKKRATPPPTRPRILDPPRKKYLRDVDPFFRKKEVRRDQVEIGKRLGSGQFGAVYCGRLLGRTMEHLTVAVKTVKDDVSDDIKLDFQNEIRIMIEIGHHPNVMEVLACCTTKIPYLLVTEMMKYGDLRNFLLRCNKPEHIQSDSIYSISDLQRYQMARQIANGMVFISSKRFYHGDLAARNILVGSDLMIKISDFGLSSDIYQKGYQRLSAERIRPVKWASIETNLEGKCTIKSDIWSYGVVLYEIFTNGEAPYKNMDGREIIRRVRDGYRMAKPDNCPDEVYDQMLLCWHEKPGCRPPFGDLFNFFDKKIAATSTLEYIDVSDDQKPSAGTATPSQVKQYPDSDDESGVSVSISDWTFERDSSLRKETALNDGTVKYSHFNPGGHMYKRDPDSDITG